MFVTSTSHHGDPGGLAGADLLCRNLATAAGLDNALAFRAWLSNESESPLTRFTQKALSGSPYILRNGRLVAASLTELLAEGPRTGLSITELGTALVQKFVWSNTAPSGEPFSLSDHCANWTSQSNLLTARSGVNALPLEEGPAWDAWYEEHQWTSWHSLFCSFSNHLYCFEDG